MSRALSNGRAQLELANSALEDILICEMGGQSKSQAENEMNARLVESYHFIQDLKHWIECLRADMKANCYEDLHILLGLNPTDVAYELANRKIADGHTLEAVARILSTTGFYGVLVHFDSLATTLLTRTSDLSVKLNRLTGKAMGSVTATLERNLPGNMKVEFAELYSAWNGFQELFFASSMISTELWYRFSKTGSLLEQPKAESVAA